MGFNLLYVAIRMILILLADPDIIQIPDIQYGLLHSSTILNVTVRSLMHVIRWTRSSSAFDIDGRISRVVLEHEDQYTCEIFLPEFDLIAVKHTEFVVIGKVIFYLLYTIGMGCLVHLVIKCLLSAYCVVGFQAFLLKGKHFFGL